MQSPARGDRHTLQDRGKKLKSTSATILFVKQAGKADYLVRFGQFQELAELEGASVFSHPLLGTYTARISEFNIRATDEQSVEVTCTILAEEEPQVVFRTSAGVSVAAGVESVTSAAGAATAALTALGLADNSPGTSLEAATGWANADVDTLDSQQVLLELATLSNRIDQAIADLEMTTNLERWPLYKAYILLRFQLGRAADAATSTAEHVFDFFVPTARPLLAICGEVYGPALAVDRAQKIAKMNRLRAPGRVPAGTTLKMISDGANA